MGNVSGALYFYPEPHSGFFVKGGVGLASYQLSQGGSTLTASELGVQAGLGYDVRVGRKLSLTPVANFYFGHDGDLSSGGTLLTLLIPGIQHIVIDVGMGVQYN